MVQSIDYNKHIYCLITGASRGIGRTISVEIARRSVQLTLVLLARSESGLLETKRLVENVNKNVSVSTYAVDLSKATVAQYEDIIGKTLSKTGKSKHESAIIFHNAGHIGSVQRATELSDPALWKNYYDLNVFSVTTLNSVFLKNVANVKEIVVVNITSLLGRKAFKYLSMYGSGKAARDIYFKVLAEEEPLITVLNYSPGMVETSMAKELCENIQGFEDSEIAASVKENPTKLTTDQTVNKLFSLLENVKFQSGDIIDYYDEC